MECKNYCDKFCNNDDVNVSVCPFKDMDIAYRVCKGFERKCFALGGLYKPGHTDPDHLYILVRDQVYSRGVHICIVDHNGEELPSGHLITIDSDGMIDLHTGIDVDCNLALNANRRLRLSFE